MFTKTRGGNGPEEQRGAGMEAPPEPSGGRGEIGMFSAPGVLMSSAIHLVLVLVAGAIVLERYILHEEEVPIVATIREAPPAIPDGPPVDPTVGHPGIPTDNEMAPKNPDDPSIFFPDAKTADHNESDDNEPYHEMKGTSRDYLSYLGDMGKGIRGRPGGTLPIGYDTMGVGDGLGSPSGRHGGPRGGSKNLVIRYNGDTRALSAVLFALRWLARHQNEDGSWSVQGFERNCGRYGFSGSCAPNQFTGSPSFDAGVTGLSLLAFLGAGHTTSSHEPVFPGVKGSPTFGLIVKKAVNHLTARQGADGLVGGAGDKYMYNHTICALALTEAYAMTALPELKDPAQRAVDYLVRAKSPGGGWRYAAQCGDTDSSVTGWAIMVLKSAEVADLRVDRSVYEDVKKYYDGVTASLPTDRLWTKPNSRGTGTNQLVVTGYKDVADAGSLVALASVNEKYDYNPALTAIMIMSRVFIDHKLAGKANGAVDTLLAYLPQKWDPKAEGTWHVADFYYWYYGSYAMFQATPDEKDPRWKRWNDAMRVALVETQNVPPVYAQQCKQGAWEPVDRWSCEGGRVYTTAMGALTLEVYYRYAKVVIQEKRGDAPPQPR